MPAFFRVARRLLCDVCVAPVMVAAGEQHRAGQVLVVRDDKVRNIQRDLRAGVDQVFLELDAGVHALLFILLGVDNVYELVNMRVGIMVVVRAGAGVVQVAVNKVNLGVLVPAPQVDLLLAVLAHRLEGRVLDGLDLDLDADRLEVGLDDLRNVGVGRGVRNQT